MKTLKIISIIAVTALTACAGMKPINESDRTFSRVVEVEGSSKTEIYSGTKIWLAEHFNSAEAVIDHDNEKDGVIIGNGIIDYPCQPSSCFGTSHWGVSFKIKTEIKENRFKLTFTNVNIRIPASVNAGYYSRSSIIPMNTQSQLNDIKPALLAFGDDIRNNITTNKASTSDW